MAHDRRLQLAQRCAGLEPELLDEQLAPSAIDVERLGLTAGSVEREHQQAAGAFAQRLAGHQLLQICQRLYVSAALQPAIGELLARHEHQLLQAGDLRPQRPLVGEVGQHRAAPERQRLGELGLLRPTARERLEATRVHLPRGRIARARLADDRRLTERTAQATDVDLDRVARRGRRRRAPDLVDQLLASQRPRRRQQQRREQQPLTRGPQSDRAPFDAYLERPQDQKLHIPGQARERTRRR